MAGENEIGNDVTAHVKSYSHVDWMMKWGTILSFITAMVAVLIISS